MKLIYTRNLKKSRRDSCHLVSYCEYYVVLQSCVRTLNRADPECKEVSAQTLVTGQYLCL